MAELNGAAVAPPRGLTYFKIEGAFGFKSKDAAFQWAERRSRGGRIIVEYSNTLKDWSAEVHTPG